MQKSIIRKGLVCLVIILFIGIAVAPSVTSIDISKDKTSNDDLVEINLQLCKTSGVEDHKMYITEEQDEQLDILIESFKEDLENSESYEETVRIYNDMIVSLDEFGLLPNGMSVKEAQRLVTGSSHRFNRLFSLLERLFKSDKNSDIELQEQEKGGIYENSYCFISWSSTRSTIADDVPFPSIPYTILSLIIYLLTRFRWGDIYFGNFDPPSKIYPAVGWIHTQGLKGRWKYEGEFHGDIAYHWVAGLDGYCEGAQGFRGFGIGLGIINFGYVKRVKIET